MRINGPTMMNQTILDQGDGKTDAGHGDDNHRRDDQQILRHNGNKRKPKPLPGQF